METTFHYENAVKARAVNGFIYALPILSFKENKLIVNKDDQLGKVQVEATGRFRALIVSKEANKEIGIKEGDEFFVAPHSERLPYIPTPEGLDLNPNYPMLQLESKEALKKWKEDHRGAEGLVPPTAQFHWQEVSFILGK